MRRGRGRTGFTLAEVAAAVALAGVVAAAALAVLRVQRDFYAGNTDRTRAQQAARAASDLLYAELRTATASDLMAATPDSVSLRVDLLRSVVCGPTPGAAPTLALFVFDSVPDANLRPGFRGWSVSAPYRRAWRHRDGVRLPDELGAGRAACEARGAPAGAPGWRYRTVPSAAVAAAFDSLPPRGAVLTRYGRLTYALVSRSDGGRWLLRNGQELAGPFRAGAALEYRTLDGSVRPSVPAGELDRVRGIRLDLVPLGPRGRRPAGGELRVRVPLDR